MSLEDSIRSGLPSLSLWSSGTSSSPSSTEDSSSCRLKNAFATQSNLMFALSDNRTVSVVFLPTSESSMSLKKLDLQFSLPLSFPLHSILVNPTGSLLALYGPKHIVVAEIPELKNGQTLSPLCKASLVSQTIPLEADTEFLKVSWHPLSAQHLVVLTNDNTLRFVNVEQIDSGAEQTFALDQMFEEDLDEALVHLDVVNFCFGDASVASWQAFCVYLLNRDSDVFALCPVVPYGCRVPAHYFSTLKKFVYSQMEEVETKVSEANAEMARARRRSHAASSAASLDMLTSQRLYLDSQIRWIAAVTGHTKAVLESSFDLITCDPNYAHRASQFSKRSNGHSESAYYFDIILQGPLETQLSLDDSPQSMAISSANVPVHDLFSISAVPLVLGRTHGSGHVEILVGVNHSISPGWSVPGANFEPNIPTLLLWSGVDLSINSGSSQNSSADDIVPVVLQPTPPTAITRLPHFDASTFLLYSSCGVVKVEIPWLHQIDSILTQSIATRARDLPSTQLSLLWNSVSVDHSMPVVLGASAHTRPMTMPGLAKSDPFIILSLFETGVALDVCAVPRPSPTASLIGLVSSHGITSSGELEKPQLPSAPARLAPKTFRSGSSSSDALSNNYNLQFYQQLARQFDSCEDQLQAMEDNIRNRIELLEKRTAQDAKTYSDSCSRLTQAASSELSLTSSFKRQQATLKSFVNRLDAVSEVVRFAADRNAGGVDSAWISELERLRAQVEKQSSAMESMESELGAVASDLKLAKLLERGIPNLDAAQASVYTETLDVQQKSIASLTDTLRKLQVQAADLEMKNGS